MPKFLATLLLLVTTLNEYASATTTINVWDKNWITSDLALLRLILDATKPTYGPYTLHLVENLSQTRAQHEIATNGRLSVIIFATSAEREQLLAPIRIPVHQGLLGQRICLIRPEDQTRFAAIGNLQQWRKSGLVIGQGETWPDTKILVHNNLKVAQGTQQDSLLKMLHQDRFDCYARSVLEVQGELDEAKEPVVAEQNLVFTYPLPSFIFTSRSNTALHARLKEGFDYIINNGQFEQHIKRHQRHKIQALDMQNRIVLPLENPYLSPETRAVLK